MPLMTWNPSLSVKVKKFDDQHMKLVTMVNELYDAMKDGKGNDVMGKVLTGLISYTSTHFGEEERLMTAHAYPDFTSHKTEHEKLVKQVMDLQQKFKSGQTVLTMSVMMFLKDWLMNHIQVVDKKYSAFFNAKGIS
jgi:hemerythrin